MLSSIMPPEKDCQTWHNPGYFIFSPAKKGTGKAIGRKVQQILLFFQSYRPTGPKKPGAGYKANPRDTWNPWFFHLSWLSISLMSFRPTM